MSAQLTPSYEESRTSTQTNCGSSIEIECRSFAVISSPGGTIRLRIDGEAKIHNLGPERPVSMAEVASYLGRSKQSVRAYMKAGLPFTRVNGRPSFWISQVKAWMERGKRKQLHRELF